MSIRSARIAALLFGSVLLTTSGLVSRLGLWEPLASAIDRMPGSDVTVHLVLSGSAAFVATWAFAPRDRGRAWWRYLAPAICVAFFAVADEWIQRWIPSRRFSASDLGANLAGVALFAAAALVLRFRRRRP